MTDAGLSSAPRQYRNAKAALRNCLDAGVRSASAINREKERDRERGRVGRRFWEENQRRQGKERKKKEKKERRKRKKEGKERREGKGW